MTKLKGLETHQGECLFWWGFNWLRDFLIFVSFSPFVFAVIMACFNRKSDIKQHFSNILFFEEISWCLTANLIIFPFEKMFYSYNEPQTLIFFKFLPSGRSYQRLFCTAWICDGCPLAIPQFFSRKLSQILSNISCLGQQYIFILSN